MKNKKSARLLVAMLTLGILLSVLAVASTGAQAALAASDTAFSIGDKFTMMISSPGGATYNNYNMTWTVVREETVGGLLCSVVTLNLTYSDSNYTYNGTGWIPKSYLGTQAVKSIVADPQGSYEMICTRNGAVSTINVGGNWSEAIFQKTTSTYTDPMTNSSNTYTDYSNYTMNYTVLPNTASITVPAGTFTCYAINSSRNDTSSYYSIIYISGKWMVKTENYYKNYTTDVFELTSTGVLVSYSGGSGSSNPSSTTGKGFTPGFETVALIVSVVAFAIVTRKKYLS